MLKFIRRRIIKGIIRDFIKDMPKYRVSARLLMLEKRDELIEKIEKVIMDTIEKFFHEYLGE